MKPLRIIVIALGIVIVVMLGVLIFASPVRGPTISNDLEHTVTTAPTSTATGTPAATTTHQAVFSPSGEIAVTAPALNAVITSPVTVEGQAPGPWYFEASFPVKVLDGDGTVLGQGPVQAQSDWMTTGTVPFAATLSFAKPKYATGTIVFHNDNPSGDPARDKEFRFPVRFK